MSTPTEPDSSETTPFASRVRALIQQVGLLLRQPRGRALAIIVVAACLLIGSVGILALHTGAPVGQAPGSPTATLQAGAGASKTKTPTTGGNATHTPNAHGTPGAGTPVAAGSTPTTNPLATLGPTPTLPVLSPYPDPTAKPTPPVLQPPTPHATPTP